jgi:UDP-glucuronate decarboxylase
MTIVATTNVMDAQELPEKNRIIAEDLFAIAQARLPWQRLNGKTVMVTGGGGFLAAFLIKAILGVSQLHHLNTRVICCARSMRNVELRLADYLDDTSLSIVLHDVNLPFDQEMLRADFVIHAASQASPVYYRTDPVGTLLANSVGTINALQYAQRSISEKFIFISSGEIYGIPTPELDFLSETDYGYLDPMQVRSCYAESKRLSETACVAWAQQFGLNTSVIRPFHTYGPGLDLQDGRVFADFVSDVVVARNIQLHSDGQAVRAFCYIADAILAFLSVILKGETQQAYNVASPDAEISMIDLAKLLVNLYPERQLKVQFNSAEKSADYLVSPVKRSVPSIAKIQKLGWSPSIDLTTGFKRTIDSFLI